MVPHLPCQYKLWIIIPIWKADIITLLLLPSQTYRNCYSYTTSILSPWVEHGATLEPFQTGLEVPKHFGTSEYKALGSFSPTLSDALPLSPPEATWCLSPSTGPYWGLCPQCSHRGSPETFPAGMQHRHRKNKQKKKKNWNYLSSSGQNLLWQKQGTQEMLLSGASTWGCHTWSDTDLYLHCSESTPQHSQEQALGC